LKNILQLFEQNSPHWIGNSKDGDKSPTVNDLSICSIVITASLFMEPTVRKGGLSKNATSDSRRFLSPEITGKVSSETS
jgi:hypothetical protein